MKWTVSRDVFPRPCSSVALPGGRGTTGSGWHWGGEHRQPV